MSTDIEYNYVSVQEARHIAKAALNTVTQLLSKRQYGKGAQKTVSKLEAVVTEANETLAGRVGLSREQQVSHLKSAKDSVKEAYKLVNKLADKSAEDAADDNTFADAGEQLLLAKEHLKASAKFAATRE